MPFIEVLGQFSYRVGEKLHSLMHTVSIFSE